MILPKTHRPAFDGLPATAELYADLISAAAPKLELDAFILHGSGVINGILIGPFRSHLTSCGSRPHPRASACGPTQLGNGSDGAQVISAPHYSNARSSETPDANP